MEVTDVNELLSQLVDDSNSFLVQGILFQNRITHRVLQNDKFQYLIPHCISSYFTIHSGPCPLLALINCMLLRNRFSMTIKSLKSFYPISFKKLIECLQNEMEKLTNIYLETENEKKLIQISQVVDIFPQLDKGLNINVKFNDVISFERSELAHQLFNLYELQMYHCWVIDPKGAYEPIYSLIAHKTYNQVQDMLLDEENSHSNALIYKFLENTKQQRTKYGVHRLYERMSSGEIATLFYNNHYSVIYKHCDDNLIYELVTDQGIVRAEERILWKTFNPNYYFANGIDEIFVDSNFEAFNDADIECLNKLKQIIAHLTKYKYSKHCVDDDDTKLEEKERENSAKSPLVKKLEDSMEFIDNFPFDSYPNHHSLQCKPIFFEKKRMSKDDLNMDLLKERPDTMRRAVSDNVPIAVFDKIDFDVRQCKVEDIQSICADAKFKLSQNERFWTKEFLTDNEANRSGFVLEQVSNNEIFGFIFYEKAEALNDLSMNDKISSIKELKLRDLTISKSTEIAMECKWNVSDWNDANERFYTSEFVLISEIGICKKHNFADYGPKLLQSIIYSFASGTRFGAEICYENVSEIDIFGSVGFVIKRNENNSFFMTLISNFSADDVTAFKKKSIVKDQEKLIEELKKSKNIKMNIQNANDDDEKYNDHEEEEEIFVPQANDNEENDVKTEENEIKKEEFSPGKLNHFCSELCCISDTTIVDVLLNMLRKTTKDRYFRIDFDQVLKDFDDAISDDLDSEKYVDLALNILFCAGFEKKRFGDFNRYVLEFEECEEKSDENQLWKVEATMEVIKKYNDSTSRTKKIEMIKSQIYDKATYWKHIFDADVHGKEIKYKTIKLLKKILRGILDNSTNLKHKSRNLNYEKLHKLFGCPAPLSLLQSYGFRKKENMYEQTVRFVYEDRDISNIQQMYDKIEYEEKLEKDQENIFGSMDDRLQAIWVHVLSNIHGEAVKKQTISTLNKICHGILSNPTNIKRRNLGLQSLQKKFHCNVPIALLKEYGFVQSYDWSNVNKMRLQYNSSDLTPLKTMQNILEKGEKMNLDNLDNAMVVSADQLAMIMATKMALEQQQQQQQQGNNLLSLMQNGFGNGHGHDDDEKNNDSESDDDDDVGLRLQPNKYKKSVGNFLNGLEEEQNNANILAGLLKLSDQMNKMKKRTNDDTKSEEDDDSDDDNMVMNGGGGYVQLKLCLSKIGLGRYAVAFARNGISSKRQMMEIDLSYVPFIIEKEADQQKFLNFIRSNKY